MSDRHTGISGVTLRTDLVEGYIFRRAEANEIELLQLRRSSSVTLSPQTWQPVFGHIKAGESAVEALCREMREETGMQRSDRLGLWQLEQVHPFFVAKANAIYLCPRFAAEVAIAWEPKLNHEHTASRWVALSNHGQLFIWPGQRAAIAELIREIIRPEAPAASLLRLE